MSFKINKRHFELLSMADLKALRDYALEMNNSRPSEGGYWSRVGIAVIEEIEQRMWVIFGKIQTRK